MLPKSPRHSLIALPKNSWSRSGPLRGPACSTVAFCRELSGDIPSASTGLNREAVIRCVGDIFAFDAELSYRRAQVVGRIIALLTPEQRAYFAAMKCGDFSTWPEVDVEPYKLPRDTEKMVNVA